MNPLQTNHTANVNSDRSARRRRGWLALLCLLVCIAGVPVYVLLDDYPFLRSSGLAAYVLMGIGTLGAALVARRDKRLWVRLAATLCAAMLVLFTVGFTWLAKLPEPASAARTLATAPDFTLPDEKGRPVSLRNTLSTEAVLLVFYRGHW